MNIQLQKYIKKHITLLTNNNKNRRCGMQILTCSNLTSYDRLAEFKHFFFYIRNKFGR